MQLESELRTPDPTVESSLDQEREAMLEEKLMQMSKELTEMIGRFKEPGQTKGDEKGDVDQRESTTESMIVEKARELPAEKYQKQMSKKAYVTILREVFHYSIDNTIQPQGKVKQPREFRLFLLEQQLTPPV